MIWEGNLQVSLWKSPAFLPSANLQICYLAEAKPTLLYLHRLHSRILLAATSQSTQMNKCLQSTIVLSRQHWNTIFCSNKQQINHYFRPTSVYLNCCSTFFMMLPHSKHLKVPWRSSGRTSLVRVTTPVTDTSFPISAVANSLNLWAKDTKAQKPLKFTGKYC